MKFLYCCLVWVCNSVCHINLRTQTEGVCGKEALGSRREEVTVCTWQDDEEQHAATCALLGTDSRHYSDKMYALVICMFMLQGHTKQPFCHLAAHCRCRLYNCSFKIFFSAYKYFSFWLTFLSPELLFLILAHPVYKMWIIQEPNALELWNNLHFEEKKNGEYIPCLKYSVPIVVE